MFSWLKKIKNVKQNFDSVVKTWKLGKPLTSFSKEKEDPFRFEIFKTFPTF